MKKRERIAELERLVNEAELQRYAAVKRGADLACDVIDAEAKLDEANKLRVHLQGENTKLRKKVQDLEYRNANQAAAIRKLKALKGEAAESPRGYHPPLVPAARPLTVKPVTYQDPFKPFELPINTGKLCSCKKGKTDG